jgi:hypothetical protein
MSKPNIASKLPPDVAVLTESLIEACTDRGICVIVSVFPPNKQGEFYTLDNVTSREHYQQMLRSVDVEHHHIQLSRSVRN